MGSIRMEIMKQGEGAIVSRTVSVEINGNWELMNKLSDIIRTNFDNELYVIS